MKLACIYLFSLLKENPPPFLTIFALSNTCILSPIQYDITNVGKCSFFFFFFFYFLIALVPSATFLYIFVTDLRLISVLPKFDA